MSVEILKKALKEKEFTIGEKSVVKLVKFGKASVVFLANDCKKSLRETLARYSKESNLEIVEIGINANEVGIICKKQFSVSVLCY